MNVCPACNSELHTAHYGAFLVTYCLDCPYHRQEPAQEAAGSPETVVRAKRRQNTAPTKYGAQKTQMDGITFDSKGESGRWQELCLREAAGEIKDLRRQVRYDLRVNGCLVSFYKADFVYVEAGQTVVEDWKSAATKTRSYVMRRKLMFALYGIEIKETGK